MNWTILVLAGLYLAAGWLFAKNYVSDIGIWRFIMILGWPVFIIAILIIFFTLFLFGVVLMIDETIYIILHKNK